MKDGWNGLDMPSAATAARDVRRGTLQWGMASLALVASVTQAFDIERSEARYADERYQFELVATIDAPLERVSAVVHDYEHYPELDERILKAQILERMEGDVIILATTLRACFGPFCRNVDRVERVEPSPQGLVATTDPTRSDVRFGETRTELSAVGSRTKVSYHTSITPNFWIPAIIGRRLMLSTLESATTDLFMNVEMRARGADLTSEQQRVTGEARMTPSPPQEDDSHAQ